MSVVSTAENLTEEEQTIPEPIKELDLSQIIRKIRLENEDVDGDKVDLSVAETAYKRFLTLHYHYPDETLVPSGVIDLVWHYHILDTSKYQEDCEDIFGEFLHHDPYFGIEGDGDANLEAWQNTKRLWKKTFNEPMIGEMHRCSNKDCR